MKEVSGSVLVFGATSAIAMATIEELAKSMKAKKFILMARNQDKLSDLASNMEIKLDCTVETIYMEATHTQDMVERVTKVLENHNDIELTLVCHGTLTDQKLCQENIKIMEESLQINALSFAILLQIITRYFERAKKGCICIIGSVAGDRGRASNYYYGASKAFVERLTQGIRAQLFGLGVQVLLVKPGFVDTPMTQSFKKGFLWAQPETVGRAIVKGIRANRPVIYTPFFWRWIMLAIKLLPGFLFHRLKL